MADLTPEERAGLRRAIVVENKWSQAIVPSEPVYTLDADQLRELVRRYDEAVAHVKNLLDDEYAEETAPDVYLGGVRERHIAHRDAACAFLAALGEAPK